MSAGYIERPAVDGALAQLLAQGSGTFALEGSAGAGKSAALLHALFQERERRGKGGRGYVRLLQLWGDEPPSLFVRRMVREVGFLHLVAYPEPDRLLKLVSDMAQAIPGLGGAGKLLGALLPDDLRPLHVVAAQALAEAGQRALDAGGPLVLGVDLLGGEVSAPVREFFTRLCERLEPTVTLVIAQPGGQASLVQLPASQRVAVGTFSPEEAEAYLLRSLELLGPSLDPASQALLRSGTISLLPGDLAQLTSAFPLLGKDPKAGLTPVVEHLKRDVAGRYKALFTAALQQPGSDAKMLELCALVATTARPGAPLTVELARSRMTGGSLLRPTELAQLRQTPLLRALCATVATMPMANDSADFEGIRTATADGGSGAQPVQPLSATLELGWPLLPASAQAQAGVLAALNCHGLLESYQDRWLQELLATVRAGRGRDSLLAGVSALSLVIERAATHPQALGQAVPLLSELETLLWRAGWHRAFAELYDALLPHLWRAGVTPREVAPRLWFRRARARVQGVDWAGQASLGPLADSASAQQAPVLSALREELPLAIEELTELCELSESAVIQARTRLGLPVDGNEVSLWCRDLPFKARQARGYARILRQLLAGPTDTRSEASRQAAMDDVLAALAHFVAHGHGEDIAQTLTILGDCYSARPDADADRLACHQYSQAVAAALALEPPPAFTLGVIHRAHGNHHRRRGRETAAAREHAEARRYLLNSPDARMGTLLAGLIA